MGIRQTILSNSDGKSESNFEVIFILHSPIEAHTTRPSGSRLLNRARAGFRRKLGAGAQPLSTDSSVAARALPMSRLST